MTRFHIVTLDPANADTASKVAAPGTAAVREIRFGQQSWLPEEIDMLRRLVPTPTPWEEIANRLDRSIAAVRVRVICSGNNGSCTAAGQVARTGRRRVEASKTDLYSTEHDGTINAEGRR